MVIPVRVAVPNNSFKPTPCRGVGHVLYATLARVRHPAAGRLNSGVRPLVMLIETPTLRSSPITIYVLLLQDDCYYVGQSCKFLSRISDHFNGKGSAWTRLHPPVAILCAKTVKTRDWKIAERFENRLTPLLIVSHGWKHVRGGFWSNICEKSTVRNLQHHNKGFVLLGAA